MLGYDAIGRQAIGQLPPSNYIALPAVAGVYAVAGGASACQIQEAAGAGSCALAGSAATFIPRLNGVSGSFSETGNAAAFSLLLTTINGTPGNVPVVGGYDGLVSSRAALGQISQQKTSAAGSGAYLINGNAALFALVATLPAGAFVVTEGPTRFFVSMSGASGAYLTTVSAATLTRDFVDWMPAEPAAATWMADLAPSKQWTPVAPPANIWTSEPEMITPPPVSQ